jgi:NTP pyrophosphatase (non-canonical NTP hydrolase)
MELNEYQEEAGVFAVYAHFLYPFLGLTEEAGEVSGKVAKRLRVMGAQWLEPVLGFDKFRTETTKELGDVLWQLQECCSVLGLSLEEVAQQNLEKLSGRWERGVIHGEGDNR